MLPFVSFKMSCPYCTSKDTLHKYEVLEQMMGTRDAFEYHECGVCGSLYLVSDISDPKQYYPDDYYSFNQSNTSNWLKTVVKSQIVAYRLGEDHILGNLFSRFLPEPMMVPWLSFSKARFNHAILDVGCGEGHYLKEMRAFGFHSLTGVDPYIERDRDFDGVKLFKRTLQEMEGSYDLIMLHHSLEHIPDPAGVLKKASMLLRPNGSILVRLPVAGSNAWEQYKEKWVQWDAPRHLHIPTIAGMRECCTRAGLELHDVFFDSDSFQYLGSELYERGMSLKEYGRLPNGNSLFNDVKIRQFSENARRDNDAKKGDQACFLIGRIPS